MNLSYIISPDRCALTVTADKATRAELHELGEEIGADEHLWDAFERLIANSELEWISPQECGDLTDAPILGIRSGDARDFAVRGYRYAVLERWAYLDYMLKSPLHDLRDTGKAVFTSP